MNVIEAAKAAGWTQTAIDMASKQEIERMERFAQIIRNQAMEEAENWSSALANKWWARHCETNKQMETTREAHEDFCQFERAIRAMRKEPQ